MKNKIRSIVMICFLAIAGIFGVSSALINKQVNETPVVEKAEAGSSHTIYFATTTSRNNYYARCQYGNNWYGSHTFSLAGRSGSNYIYTASVYEEFGGLDNLWIKYGNDPSGDTGGTLVFQAISKYQAVSTYENKVTTAANTWKDIYTVTYNPNGASGSTKTEYKINGVAYSILSYSSAGISSHSYKHSVKWSTNSEGTGTDYQPGASYTTNANLTLYFIEDWYTYQFKVNDGSWNTLTKTDDTPSGYVAQFSANYSFTSGDTITFQRYYGTESATTVSPTGWERNISNSGEIYYSATGSIYVKVNNDNNHTILVDGFYERGVVVVRGGHNYKIPCTTKTKGDAGEGHTQKDHEWKAFNIMLLPGDTLEATYNGGTPYAITVENTDVYGISSSGSVTTPGYYNIYLKSDDYGYNFPTVYLEMIDDATATLIAQKFNEALTTVCNSTVGGGATSQITSAFTTQSNYYSHLTSDCKDLVASDSTSDADIIAMRSKYDYIVNKYGKTIAPDYLGRNPGAKAAINDFSSMSLFGGTEDNLSTVIIIISSSVALLSITALSILVIKKRKNKEE